MRINPKATAALTTVMLLASGTGVAYAADGCPGMGGTSTTGTTTTGTTTTTATTTTTSASSDVIRHATKRHVNRHAGRL